MTVNTATPTDESVLRAIIGHFLNLGAKAAEDARWLVSILPADLQAFFRVEVIAAIKEKAGNPAKARKIFLSLGKTARAIFGDTYAQVKRDYDRASKKGSIVA